MNGFDGAILALLNQYAQQSWLIDRLIAFFAETDIVQGVLVISVVWWAWFRPPGKRGQTRRILIGTFAGCFASLLIVRGLAILLPFRARPMANPEIDWVAPLGAQESSLELFSSFPSDHAALFVALASGICMVSKRAGLLTLAYTLVVICLARVYLGFHYPTDILAGAAIGFAMVRVATLPTIRRWLASYPLHLLQTQPSFFYVGLFLVTFETARLFDDVAAFGSFVAMLVKAL